VATAVRFNPHYQCESKVKYRKKDVKRTLKRLQTRPDFNKDSPKADRRLWYYRCPWCAWWHIGHQIPEEVWSAQNTVEAWDVGVEEDAAGASEQEAATGIEGEG